MALRTAGTAPRRLSSITRRWWNHPDNVIIGLTMVLTVAIATTLGPPAKVPPLRIVNQSDLTVSLDVRPPHVAGWMGLGIVPPGRTTIEEVVDQGDRWIVRAQVGSHTAAPFMVTRAQLESHRWTLTVPTAATEALRRSGAVPEP